MKSQEQARDTEGGTVPALTGIFRPEDSALLVIDMQNAFCHLDGGLAKAGRNVRPMNAIIPDVRAIVGTARRAGLPIIWTLQEHLGENDRAARRRRIPSHLDKFGVAGAEAWCVRNTWDAEIVEELASEFHTEDYVIRKHRMSAFYSTTLDSLLRILGIQVLLVIGLNTYVCVESTIRDAYFRDFDIVEVADAVAASDPELHAASLRKTEMYFGTLATTEQVLVELEALIKPEGEKS